MIVIALGSNLPSRWGGPEATLQQALEVMPAHGIIPLRCSRLLITSPFGRTDQPSFTNAVALIATTLNPTALLSQLHAIERAAGRERTERWGPRALDLDIIDYEGLILPPEADQITPLQLPHPGIAERAFVLQPLSEVAPAWRHPETGASAALMLRALSATAQGAEI